MQCGDDRDWTILGIVRVNQNGPWIKHFVLMLRGLDIIQEVENLPIEFFAQCAGELLKKPRACVDGQCIIPPLHDLDRSERFICKIRHVLARIGVESEIRKHLCRAIDVVRDRGVTRLERHDQ